MIVHTDWGTKFVGVAELSGLGEATADDLAETVVAWLKKYWYVVAVGVVLIMFLRGRR